MLSRARYKKRTESRWELWSDNLLVIFHISVYLCFAFCPFKSQLSFQTEVDIMCKLSSLFFPFACHWLHVLCWCLVPGTWHWPSCLWKEALQLVCLMRRKESLLGLVTPQKAMVMFHCTLCPHCMCLCVRISLCRLTYKSALYSACVCLALLLVQCPLHVPRIASCSANLVLVPSKLFSVCK